MADKTKKTTGKGSESKIDKIDWALIEQVLGSDVAMRIYMYGPAGVGKTFAAYTQGLRGRELYAVTLLPETPSAELRGMYLPKGDALVWHDGIVVVAMKAGARLVINEISHGSEDALAFLFPCLESPETCRVTLPTGETVVPADGYQVVITDNLPPDDLPPALRDRFDALLEINEPHPDALARLSEPFREVARRGVGLDDERRLSVRPLLAIDRMRHVFGLRNACLVVLGAVRGSMFFDAIRLAGVV